MPLGRRTLLAPIAAPFVRWASRLRFPWLLAITVVLLGADIVIPDVIPFADEILLGLVAAVLAGLKKRPGRKGRG